MKECILRLCLQAYPRVSRERNGRALLDLARDLSGESHFSFLREAGSLLSSGLGERGKLLRLDVTGAPWRAARERLALPLAVAMLCFFVAFAFPSRPHWVGWWSLLALLGAAAAVFGAASGRRLMTVVASLLVLSLLIYDAFRELTTHYARWVGDVFVGQVNILAMWLPVALLLLICAGAVGRTPMVRRRGVMWIICAPVAVSIFLAVLARSRWQSEYGSPLAAVFMYTPLALVVGAAIHGVMQRNAVTRTAAALLVATGCVPVLWLLAMVVPEPPVPGQYLPFAYYLPGIVVACFVMVCLLRRRTQSPA